MKNLLAFFAMASLMFSCESGQDKKEKTILADTLVNYTVRAAPEWTNLFYRNEGWFGADGIFSITFDGDESFGSGQDKEVMLSFSDTMTGTVLGDSAVENFKMVNNSFAYVQNAVPSEETVSIEYKKNIAGEALSYFSPNTPNTLDGEYYWMGEMFVNKEDNNSINIFGYRVFDKSEASWDFEIRGVTIITIPEGERVPFERQSQIDAPLFMNLEGIGSGTFGSGVYMNTEWAGAPNPDGYMYIYGLIDPNKQLVVARVEPKNFKNFNEWKYWDGQSWQDDITKTRPVTDRVSNEVSLTPMKDGRYLLVFQSDGIGATTAIRIGKSPVGPFGPLQHIWKAPEAGQAPGIIPYNAKAHPVLSTENELLISYNTISYDYFKDILTHPHMYRPRFFWLTIND
ncbi:MAG: DUF4185 domain-containing protein [Reichenbachiella sp.]